MSTLIANEDKDLSCDHYTAVANWKMSKSRILLLTPYTGGNLGDGAIQDALIHHLRKRLADVQIRLVTLQPRVTSRLHGLPSFPIASSVSNEHTPERQSCGLAGVESCNDKANHMQSIKARLRRVSWIYRVVSSAWRGVRKAGSLVQGGQRELRHLFRAHQLIRETDILVVAGGGQIDDYWGGPFGHPYALFKWAALARLSKRPVVFLSVGVCSLNTSLSRRFAFQALRLATYRSYRDRGSKELLKEAKFTQTDCECPDLAFSHPCVQRDFFVTGNSNRKNFVVGVSPIAYLSPHGWPERDPEVYGRYLQTVCEFTEMILEAGHTVALFTSSQIDQFAVGDLQARLRQNPKSESWRGRLLQLYQTCLDRQLDEIRGMDMVVASRLHGIILSHLLAKPTLAISYDRKVHAHMEAMDQEQFCLDFRNCTSHQLWDYFESLRLQSPAISAAIQSKVREFSQELDLQYDELIQIIARTLHARQCEPAVKPT